MTCKPVCGRALACEKGESTVRKWSPKRKVSFVHTCGGNIVWLLPGSSRIHETGSNQDLR